MFIGKSENSNIEKAIDNIVEAIKNLSHESDNNVVADSIANLSVILFDLKHTKEE